MIEQLKRKYQDWQYVNEHNPAGWSAFWWSLQIWWQYRPHSVKNWPSFIWILKNWLQSLPRLAECSAGCGIMSWQNDKDILWYCSETCATQYGNAYWVPSPDEIPF